jgi:hypothetical protein
MNIKEFKEEVDDFFKYLEYVDDCQITYEQDDDGEPEANVKLTYGCDEYCLNIMIGEDGNPGIHTFDYFTIPLEQEEIYAWLFFEEQKRHRMTKEKIKE